jgi:uncharacterized protein (TIGR00725 family)
MKHIYPEQLSVYDYPCKKIERVSFFGFSDAPVEDPLYKLVFETAKSTAEKGYIVVNGGGPGVMEAAGRGAKAGGGKTIGVTFYPKDVTNFEGRNPANPIDDEIITTSYLERTLRLLEYGQIYMIFQGGSGTISEFGMAWAMARLYYGHHKPLILVGDFWRDLIEAFKRDLRIREEELRVLHFASDAVEAVNILLEIDEDIAEMCYNYQPKSEEERPFIL